MPIVHTPAPWTVSPDPEWPEDYFSVYYDVGGTGAEIAGRIGEPANAQLIAAAPDLLAALESLRAELRAHIKFDVKRHYSLMVADVVADKAIAKAKGDV